MTKQKKEPTAAQLAARLANGERLKKMAQERKANNQASVVAAPPSIEEPEEDIQDKTDYQEVDVEKSDLLRQIREANENIELLKRAILGSAQTPAQPSQGVSIGNQGKLVGEVEKYLVDPDNYPDPTPRLSQEPRLKAVNFDWNYELDYRMDIVSYETKTGVNMKEPKFHINLNRVVLDDQGNQTNKRYIAKRLVFHEDPQAAIVIARELGLAIDTSNEKAFLDEMRYQRCKAWLFGVFWPKPVDVQAHIQEEVIGGTIVQVFTKASEDASEIDFDKLNTKF